MRCGVGKLLQPQVRFGELLTLLQSLCLHSFPRIDIPLVYDDCLHFGFKQEIGSRAFYPGVVAVFTANARIPLARTRSVGERVSQGSPGMVTIFGMNEFQTIAPQQFFRMVSEDRCC